MRWLIVLLVLPALALAAPEVTDVRAICRHGQTFVTWRESGFEAGARVAVLLSGRPITDPGAAGVTVLSDRLMPGSARDWWLDPETYGAPSPAGADGKKPAVPQVGWIIEEGGQPLDASGGLYVHTVTPETAGQRYYAVVDAAQKTLQAGVNSLAQPVEQQVATPQPIWQGKPEERPKEGAGEGLPLELRLHAKRGRGAMQWLMFGDTSLGWRDGLPYKFGAELRDGAVMVTPTDRTWIDRMFPEGRDECQRLTPALHSFWFGYNEFINDPAKMAEGKVINYTERRLLRILEWTRAQFHPDPNRTYCTGGSMGGCGTMSFAFRHPEIFAAVSAIVPIVAYDRGAGGDSAMRIERECGSLDALTLDGVSIKNHLDGTRFVLDSRDDLPYLFIVTGRNDGSIPWWKNPDFYRALNSRRQGHLAAWNDGEHGSTQGKLPPDLRQRAELKYLRRFALNKSYLAFSRCSTDLNPGHGGKQDGDPAGAFNWGLEFDDPVETAERYEAVVRWYREPDKLPVTVDITPRRRQAFRPGQGAKVRAENVELASGKTVQTLEATVDELGWLTVAGFQVTSQGGNRLVLTNG